MNAKALTDRAMGMALPLFAWATWAAAFVLLTLGSCTVTLPIAATGAPMGSKEGRASATQVCGAWIRGDASIKAAAAAGGIGQVSTVDLRTTNVLGVYVRRTCIVTGNGEPNTVHP